MSRISSLLRSSIVMRLCIPVHRFLHSKRPDLNIRCEGFMGVAARVPSMSSVDALAEMVEQAAHRRRRSLESATMSVLMIQLLGALWLLQPTVGSLLEGQQRPLGPETVGGAILALLFALILLDLVDDAPRTRTRVAALATIGAPAFAVIAIAAYQPDLAGAVAFADVHLRRWDRISSLGAHAQRTVGRHAVPFIHGDPRGHPLSITDTRLGTGGCSTHRRWGRDGSRTGAVRGGLVPVG